jgi:hypothetical protein
VNKSGLVDRELNLQIAFPKHRDASFPETSSGQAAMTLKNSFVIFKFLIFGSWNI